MYATPLRQVSETLCYHSHRLHNIPRGTDEEILPRLSGQVWNNLYEYKYKIDRFFNSSLNNLRLH